MKFLSFCFYEELSSRMGQHNIKSTFYHLGVKSLTHHTLLKSRFYVILVFTLLSSSYKQKLKNFIKKVSAIKREYLNVPNSLLDYRNQVCICKKIALIKDTFINGVIARNVVIEVTLIKDPLYY